MIFKVEMLLDIDPEQLTKEWGPQAVADFINFCFKENPHLGKIIICEVENVPDKG